MNYILNSMEACKKCRQKVKKTYSKKHYDGKFCWPCHKKLPMYPPRKRKEKVRELKEMEAKWNNKTSLRRWNQGHGYNF